MKILIVADGQLWDIHGGAFAKAWQAQGHTVTTFTWKQYFYHYQYPENHDTPGNPFASIWYRFQNKFTLGPTLAALNRGLIQQAQLESPDLIFIHRGTHIWPETLNSLRAQGFTLFGYNNDDPFGPTYPKYFWRHFKGGLPYYHQLFAYRQKNITDYQRLGYNNVTLLRSYYRPEHNFPVANLPADTPYACDVIFVGHYEPDGRDAALLALLNAGIQLQIHGPDWENSPYYGEFCDRLGYQISRLYGPEYNLALNAAKIALVFLSHLNRDSYTRRCFEIPATGTLMLAQYTDDLAHNLFTPNEDAVYFTSTADLLQHAQRLLANPAEITRIGNNGRQRLLRDGHTVADRADAILRVFQNQHPLR